MITERHNIACRLIMKALSKASLGACIVSMDIGSKDRLAQQDLQIPENTTNRVIPKWLLPPNFSDKNRLTCSRPDAILVAAKPMNTTSAPPRQVSRMRGQRRTGRARETTSPATCARSWRPHEIPKSSRHVHLVEVKYCEDTRPNNQLEASRRQHIELCKNNLGAKVTLHTILLGVGGTIYVPHTLDQFIQLGLDTQRATKLANKLLAHSVCYA